ncbi:Superoxide dismutase [Kickxella alabastrina]|uniref:Superoxide dismutase n=1 Tax=Kickxella alabastrina TaxID=61397 RepID=A0ACC1IRJ9_9FUNG|nr:Superoxide dismutase [Kickxella alabastrina]
MLKNILSLIIAATIVVAGTSNLTPATSDTNPSDIVLANANLVSGEFNAAFEFTPAESKNGLQLAVTASGLDMETAYSYHIHAKLVPADGNCTETGGHLDPFKIKETAGTAYKCDKDNAQTTCELGDLAGMFGSMTADADGKFTLNAPESILTFGGDNNILGYSVVIHRPDSTRLACANIDSFTAAPVNPVKKC